MPAICVSLDRKTVSFPAHGLDDFLRIVAKLLAQPGYVHIDSPGLHALGGDVPDPGENLFARDRAAGIHREIPEQFRLHGREAARAAVVECNFARSWARHTAAEPHLAGGPGTLGRSPQHRFDPRDELLHAERLD